MNRSTFFKSILAGLIGGYGALVSKVRASELTAPRSTPNPTNGVGASEHQAAYEQALKRATEPMIDHCPVCHPAHPHTGIRHEMFLTHPSAVLALYDMPAFMKAHKRWTARWIQHGSMRA